MVLIFDVGICGYRFFSLGRDPMAGHGLSTPTTSSFDRQFENDITKEWIQAFTTGWEALFFSFFFFCWKMSNRS